MPRGGGFPAAVNMYQNVNDEPLLNLVKGVTSAERAVGAAAGLDRAGQDTAGLGRTGPLCADEPCTGLRSARRRRHHLHLPEFRKARREKERGEKKKKKT